MVLRSMEEILTLDPEILEWCIIHRGENSGAGGGGGGFSLVKIGLFANSCQTNGPKWLIYTGFNEGHPGVVIRKFHGDQSETQPVGLLSPKISLLWSQLYI